MWPWRKKPVEIPNPRDRKRKLETIDRAQRNVLGALQIFCFVLAYLIYLVASR